MIIYELMKFLNKRGCRVSISEIKDAIDILANVDLSDQDLVFNVMISALGKDDVCRTALEDLRESKGMSILGGLEKEQTPTYTQEVPEPEVKEKEEKNQISEEEKETWGWNW